MLAVATTFVFHATQQASINYYKGHDLFVQGDYEAAASYFARAVALDPEYKEALTELAYSLLWTGRSEESIHVFQQLLLLEPDLMKSNC